MLSIEYSLNVPSSPPTIDGLGRDWLKSRRVDGSLLAYYLSTFRPFLRTQPQWAKHELLFDSAINAFHDFVGRQIELTAITPELFSDFFVWLRTHATEASGHALSHVLHCVLSSFDRNRFLVRQWGVARPGETGGYEVRHLAELDGEPGTFLHFLENCLSSRSDGKLLGWSLTKDAQFFQTTAGMLWTRLALERVELRTACPVPRLAAELRPQSRWTEIVSGSLHDDLENGS